MKLKFIPLLLLLTYFSKAQNEANIWYFGDKAGINFNDPCNPVVLNNGLNSNAFEGTSTISDANSGQLLFYTDGYKIYNKNHIQMGSGNLISNSPTQTLIIKKPKSNSVFYLITPEIQGNIFNNNYGLHCAIIDLTLNGGLGDVTNGNNQILLNSPVTEKLTAVKHTNGTDIWLICHTYNDNNFKVFLIDSTGINSTPIISSIGSNHVSSTYGWGAIGEMKASPNRQKLAVVNYSVSLVELFDFNNSTGQITNPILLPSENFSYGLSFSPDDSKLYVTSEAFYRSVDSTISKLYQFDLTSNNQTAIANSKTVIFEVTPSTMFPNVDYLGSLKIAPDNKIYVGRGNQKSYLGVINNPNLLGTNCNYVHNGFYLENGKAVIGLNNAMEIEYNGCSNSISDINKVFTFNLYPNPAQQSFNIELPQQQNFNLLVYDVTGRKVYQSKNAAGIVKVDCSSFTSGIYFVQAVTEKTVLSSKLIKQ